jgi:hypothetical protein
VEFNGSMRHFFGKAQDDIFRLIDKKENIRDILKQKENPYRDSIMNHVLLVVRQLRDSLLQRNAKLKEFFPGQTNDILQKENKGDGNGKQDKKMKKWTTTAITFTFILVNKLGVQEEEVSKLIYLFRLEGSQDVDLNVIQKWLSKDVFVEQYFDYYLVANPKAYEM